MLIWARREPLDIQVPLLRCWRVADPRDLLWDRPPLATSTEKKTQKQKTQEFPALGPWVRFWLRQSLRVKCGQTSLPIGLLSPLTDLKAGPPLFSQNLPRGDFSRLRLAVKLTLWSQPAWGLALHRVDTAPRPLLLKRATSGLVTQTVYVHPKTVSSSAVVIGT